MRRKARTREEYIAAVVNAWNDIAASDKPELMVLQSDLYFACAWLAAHETVAKERRWRW